MRAPLIGVQPIRSISVIVALIALIIIAGSITTVAHSQDRNAEPQLYNYSVAVSGDRAVIGVEWQEGFKGTAYVLRRSRGNWVLEQQLTPADLGPYDHFGGSVAIDGEHIVVGASWQGLLRGAVYVFKREDGVWTEQQKITPGESVPDQHFGQMVSLSGGKIAVHDGRNISENQGMTAAYQFESIANRWVKSEKNTQPLESFRAAQARARIDKTDPENDRVEMAALIRPYSEPPPHHMLNPPSSPDSVDSVTATDGDFEDRVEIVWPSVELDAIVYMIKRDGDLISVVSSDETHYSDTPPEFDLPYEYCVVVKNMAGLESTPVCDYGHRTIFAPLYVSASDGEYIDRIEITWTDISSINTGYSIYRSDEVEPIGTTGAYSSSFTDSATTVTPEVEYDYEVVATVDGIHESAPGIDSGWLGIILPPDNVSASDGQYLDLVRITWEHQAPNRIGYKIYREGEPIDSTDASATAYDDATADFGVTYEYCVATMMEDYTGVPEGFYRTGRIGGNESVHVCDTGGTGLIAPANVSASDGQYDDRVRVTWEDRSDFESGYEILRDASGDTVVLDTTGVNAIWYNDFTAVAETDYTYFVRATNNLGGVSADSSDTGYRSLVLAPTSVEASDGTIEDRVLITWESASTTAVLFKIYRDGQFIKSVSSADRSHRDYDGTAGQTYVYSVAAVTALEVEAMGLSDEGRRELTSPSLVVASDEAYEDKIVISWTDNSNLEQGYIVARRDTSAAVVDTTWLDSNRTSFNDRTSIPGVTYRYSVSAFDNLGESLGYSVPVEDLGRRVLLAPADVRADDGVSENQIEITWIDNSNAEDGYYIYRDAELADSTSGNFTSFVDTSPDLGQTTYYSVRAFDGFGGVSEAASDSGHTTILAPVSFNASDFYGDRIELTWVDRSGIEDGYMVYRDSDTLATLTGPNITSYTDYPQGDPEFVGSSPTPGLAADVAVAGNYAFVADWASGLTVIGISDPENLSLTECSVPGQAFGVTVVGNYAYVAADNAGLQIVDISEPESATHIGGYNTAAFSYDVAIVGNIAYVADAASGLQVIDVSDPEIPTWVSSCDTPHFARGIVVRDNYAYIADGDSGLAVINVSNPADPQLVGGCPTPNFARRIAVRGEYAYVPDGDLQVIDISTPESPHIVATCQTPGASCDVTLHDDYAYVADYESGLQVVNISDPANPVLVGSYDTAGAARGVTIAGSYAFVADYTSGLTVLSILPSHAYNYCVRAYQDSLFSASVCDDGNIHITETDNTEATTELFMKLLASDGGEEDQFAGSVSISGDYAIVGASYDSDIGTDAGAAYIFERVDGTWTEKQKLTADDGAAGDGFGRSVSISGNRAIVSAEFHEESGDNDQGAAYIFLRTDGTWSQEEKLRASDGSNSDYFGKSVSINNQRAIVGACSDDVDGIYNSGSAYIFELVGNDWDQKAKLAYGDPEEAALFGWSVSISGHLAIVGAPCDDACGLNSGVIAFFKLENGDWDQAGAYCGPDTGEHDLYGRSVSISGDRAIVGALCHDGNGWNSGAAYIFERVGTTGIHQWKVAASDGVSADQFGQSVSISGDRAIVGALECDNKGENSGAAYVFERGDSTWTETEKFTMADGAAGDNLGFSVSISGQSAIIGAPYDDDNGDQSGSACIAELATAIGNVAASDGTLNSRVRVTWEDRSFFERGFRVYRDGEPISTLEPNVQGYEDFDAEPGRTYEYGVASLTNDIANESIPVTDFGWRPANGNITGRISTRGGAAAENISVSIDPVPTKALLFDGNGGHIRVPDAGGSFNFNTGTSFTIETWVKYSGIEQAGGDDGTVIAKATAAGGAKRYPFLFSDMRSTGHGGQLQFAMSDSSSLPVSVSSLSDSLNDNTWHHVACVHDADEEMIILYVDGILQNSTTCAGLGDITNSEAVSLGAGPDSSSWFGGQLDEVRIWNVARNITDIQAALDKQLTGNEEGLVAYWPFDQGGAAITDRCDGAHYGIFEDGVYWTEDSVPLDIYPVTDLQGNYVLNDLYYGTEATFEVRPFDGNRQFDPPVQRVVLTTESPVENQVNFIDISSFTVSGRIMYAATQCGAVDIPILVDNQQAGATDSNGQFAVSVDVGEHWIRPDRAGHRFSPDSLFIDAKADTVVNDSTGIAFSDSLTYMLSGKVGGGCGHPIGDVNITIRSENACYDSTFTVNSGEIAYSRMLPPQNYLVSAAVVGSSIPDSVGLDKTDIVEYFQNLGVRLAEMDSLDVEMDFVYRAPLQVEITGFEDYVETCDGPLTFANRTLPDNLPVIPQLTMLVLTIEVNENYGSGQLCELDSCTVTIYDEIFDRQNSPFELELRNGAAVCTTFTSTPSLVLGRIDEYGIDRSFQKAFHAVVDVEGRTPVTATEWVIVTGHVAPEGADFVTATTSAPLYILRDPPGDNSFASLEQGYTSRTRIDWEREMWDLQGGLHLDIKTGWELTTFIGLGAGAITHTEVMKPFETDQFVGNIRLREESTDITLTTRETFTTSAGDPFIGSGGDLFVGAGVNFTFTEVGVIEVDAQECAVIKSTAIGFEPDSIKTVYAYTQQYISDVLMPELDSKVEHYTQLAEADSAMMFATIRDDWDDLITANDSLKAVAVLSENRSFSAGADYTNFASVDTTIAYTRTNTFVSEGSLSLDGWSWDLPGADLAFNIIARHRHEQLSDDVDSTGTSEIAVSYTLSDDDIGDHFTVDIKNDGRYPSPVFDVLAGVSSCPYEPWPDPETGDERMMPRDKPQLSISPIRRDAVPLGEPAVFTLTLANMSPTQESRLYKLRLLTTSNPHGAIVKAGGMVLANGIEYFVDPVESQLSTLTVERGPTHYEYDSLAVILYPPCEYALWEDGGPLQQTATLYFDVTFDAPCSDITLYLFGDPDRPETGWVYDKADSDTEPPTPIELWLCNYELDIGNDGGSLESVGAEFRRRGDGRDGPGPWTEIMVVASPDSAGTTINWTPAESLSDGVYEIRAYTNCDGGFGYSETSVGTIERNGPMVLGTPEPADGVLSFGEDISVTFNEPIDCRTVNPDNVTLTYLDGPNPGGIIDIETVCDETTIVLTPTASASALEGRRIRARVAGVTDKAGNPLVSAMSWQFDYRKSQFAWSPLHLAAEVPYRNPGAVVAELVNGTEQPVEFNIVGTDPALIISATPSFGTIPPSGKQSVSFTLRENLTLDEVYYDEILATAADSSQGVAVITLQVMASCQEPAWEVDPSEFQHTMTIVTALNVGGTISADGNDKVAAFVGNQLRGVVSLEEVPVGQAPYPFLAFLTIHSNRVSGETVRFQVWDADSCRLHGTTVESYPFAPNSFWGSPGDPETLTTIDGPGENTLRIPVAEGWSWISTNISSDSMSVTALLSDLTPAPGDIIKSPQQMTFSQFVDDSIGWSGTLSGLDNVSGYMLRLSEPGTIVHAGTPAPIDTPVPVGSGWNWIGYVPQETGFVTETLCGLDALEFLTEGDQVKSQPAFAEYSGGGWYGSLDSLRAGEGYMLYLSSAPDSSFTYTPCGLSPLSFALVASVKAPIVPAAKGAPDWSVDAHAYQHNMTVTAVLRIGETESIDEYDMVAAFVGDECRGLTRPVDVEGIGRHEIFLVVCSNEAEGESISLRAFDANPGVIYDIVETLTFEADKVEGTVRGPVAFTTGSVWDGDDLPRMFALAPNAPNPFSPTTVIAYNVPSGGGYVTIRVYDVTGRMVRRLVDGFETPGRKKVSWDGQGNQNQRVPTGVYFYRMTAPGFVKTRKMMIY
jgi:hypothetical protein